MAGSAAYEPVRRSSCHLPPVSRVNRPSADARAGRPRPAGRGLRPSQVPVRRAAAPTADAPTPGHDAGGGDARQAAPVQRSAVRNVLRGSGRPLPEPVRMEMEDRFGGADFAGVRIHDDSAARESAAAVGARAYACGAHVVTGPGEIDKRTLAHELTHVVQQGRGPVAGTCDGSGLLLSSPGDRFEREAEANAQRVLSGPAPQVCGQGHARAGSAGQVVQRMTDPPGPPGNPDPGRKEEKREKPGKEEQEKEEETRGGAKQGEKKVVQVPAKLARTLEPIIVPCVLGENGKWVAHLPAGVEPYGLHDTIARKLGVEPAAVRFTNLRTDTVAASREEKHVLTMPEKIYLAKWLAAEYLVRAGIAGASDKTFLNWLGAQEVEVPQEGEWAGIVMRVTRERNPAETGKVEGITTPARRGNRNVWINGVNHTFPAIVHELFHVLEHDSMHTLTESLAEGITEYFTTRATGVEERVGKNMETFYTSPLRFIREEIGAGRITEKQLQGIYFHGIYPEQRTALEKRYFDFTQLEEQQAKKRFGR